MSEIPYFIMNAGGPLAMKVAYGGYKKMSAVWNFEEERYFLRSRVKIIGAALSQARNAQIESEVLQVWHENAKPLFYEAEAVVDKIDNDLRKLKSRKGNKILKMFKKWKFRWRMAGEMERAHSKLNKISKLAEDGGALSRLGRPGFVFNLNIPKVDQGGGAAAANDALSRPGFVFNSNIQKVDQGGGGAAAAANDAQRGNSSWWDKIRGWILSVWNGLKEFVSRLFV